MTAFKFPLTILLTFLHFTSGFLLPILDSLEEVQQYRSQQHQVFPRETGSTSQEYLNDSTFRAAILNSTNAYRRQHNASALVWNNTLQRFAEGVSGGCVFAHSGGPYGENLASGYPSAAAAVAAWGDERDKYNFKKGDFSKETGHFTQLVWKETTSLGCSRTKCDSKNNGGAPGYYVVCEYAPAGNVLGNFRSNVQERVKGDGDQKEEEKEKEENCPQGSLCSAASELKGSCNMWGVVLVSLIVGWFGLIL